MLLHFPRHPTSCLFVNPPHGGITVRRTFGPRVHSTAKPIQQNGGWGARLRGSRGLLVAQPRCTYFSMTCFCTSLADSVFSCLGGRHLALCVMCYGCYQAEVFLWPEPQFPVAVHERGFFSQCLASRCDFCSPGDPLLQRVRTEYCLDVIVTSFQTVGKGNHAVALLLSTPDSNGGDLPNFARADQSPPESHTESPATWQPGGLGPCQPSHWSSAQSAGDMVTLEPFTQRQWLATVHQVLAGDMPEQGSLAFVVGDHFYPQPYHRQWDNPVHPSGGNARERERERERESENTRDSGIARDAQGARFRFCPQTSSKQEKQQCTMCTCVGTHCRRYVYVHIIINITVIHPSIQASIHPSICPSIRPSRPSTMSRTNRVAFGLSESRRHGSQLCFGGQSLSCAAWAVIGQAKSQFVDWGDLKWAPEGYMALKAPVLFRFLCGLAHRL